MALSFTEKRALQKELKSTYATLGGGVGFQEKRALQKKLQDLYVKLNAKENEIEQYRLPDNFTTLAPDKFRSLMVSANEDGATLDILRSATVNYLKANEELLVGSQ